MIPAGPPPAMAQVVVTVLKVRCSRCLHAVDGFSTPLYVVCGFIVTRVKARYAEDRRVHCLAPCKVMSSE
jgi:hypothetical protein